MNKTEIPKNAAFERIPDRFSPDGLQRTIGGIIAVCFLVTIVFVSGISFFESWRHANAQATETALYNSKTLTQQMAGAIKLGKIDRLHTIFNNYETDSKNALRSIHVQKLDGTEISILGSYISANMIKLQPTDLSSGDAWTTRIGNILYISVPATSALTGEAVGRVSLIWDRTQLTHSLWMSLLRSSAAALIATALGMAVVMWKLSRVVIAPLKEMALLMETISNRNFDVIVPYVTREDEIGVIARNLLSFRNRLAEEDQTRRKRAAADDQKITLFLELSQALSDVAAGRIERRINIEGAAFSDEDSRQVTKDFNALMENLEDIISTVVTTAESVKISSAEISEVANTQSRRSEAQASTLEESAAALDGLTQSVKAAAKNAAEADNAVSENRRQAETSGDVVRRAIDAMKQIEDSSSQITQIISVIDDIAFQTNMLALNAEVEAARAGESGRGFAVVASEVRALAQRASESAREIKDLISTSRQQVNEGAALVGQTGNALSEIIVRFGKVSDLVSSIAASLKEQSIGLDEINSGINQLDKVTQQNAAVIEETSASSQILNDEAGKLTAALSKFQRNKHVRTQKATVNAPRDGNEHAFKVLSITMPPKANVEPKISDWSNALNENFQDDHNEDWTDF